MLCIHVFCTLLNCKNVLFHGFYTFILYIAAVVCIENNVGSGSVNKGYCLIFIVLLQVMNVMCYLFNILFYNMKHYLLMQMLNVVDHPVL